MAKENYLSRVILLVNLCSPAESSQHIDPGGDRRGLGVFTVPAHAVGSGLPAAAEYCT